MVDHQQMIAIASKRSKSRRRARHLRRRLRAHLVVEDAIAQRLRGIDLGSVLRQPHLQRFETHIDDWDRWTRDRTGRCFRLAHEHLAHQRPYRDVTFFRFVRVAVERHREQLEPVIDQLVAEPRRHLALQRLDLFVAELDHAAGLQVDEMIVMLARHFLVARAAVAEIVPLEDVRLLEQAHGAIDGGDADLGIDLAGAAIHALDIGMIGRLPTARAR